MASKLLIKCLRGLQEVGALHWAAASRPSCVNDHEGRPHFYKSATIAVVVAVATNVDDSVALRCQCFGGCPPS